MELWYNAGFGKVLTCCDFDFGNNYLDLESNVVNMGKCIIQFLLDLNMESREFLSKTYTGILPNHKTTTSSFNFDEPFSHPFLTIHSFQTPSIMPPRPLPHLSFYDTFY